jgi:alpha-methylacyl-CoA racemase
VPFAGAVLAGLGAAVLRVERPGAVPLLAPDRRLNVALRSRTSVVLDLKEPLAVEAVLRLAAGADALLEGWRPGVAERLGVGPDACFARNDRLVYGRMTGWGQDGPLSATAGHDINYVALTGVLHAIGRAGGPPVPPLNLVGDFGGGGMLLAVGVLSALLEARASGLGQVVDAAMVDGASLLALSLSGYVSAGMWNLERGTNMLDSGAPFYDVYETADGKWVAVGAIEAPFYGALLAGLELDPATLPGQLDRDRWPELRARLVERFRTRKRDEWERVFAGTDACVTPVLTLVEAPAHPHNAARGSYLELDGIQQAVPAPRFSRTPAATPVPPVEPETHTREVLVSLGFDDAELARLI